MGLDWGNVPGWIAALTAVIAATVGLRQFRLATRAQIDQVQVARAKLLLEIDANYESADIYRSRKAIRSLRNRSEAIVQKSNSKDKSLEGVKKDVCVEFSHQMGELWKLVKDLDDPDVEKQDSAARLASDRYAELMSLPYWIETVGMLCNRNLLPTDDVLDLYDQVIITTMSSFAIHIERRRQEGPFVNPRFLANASWMLEQALVYKSNRDSPPASRPGKSPTRWN